MIFFSKIHLLCWKVILETFKLVKYCACEIMDINYLWKCILAKFYFFLDSWKLIPAKCNFSDSRKLITTCQYWSWFYDVKHEGCIENANNVEHLESWYSSISESKVYVVIFKMANQSTKWPKVACVCHKSKFQTAPHKIS